MSLLPFQVFDQASGEVLQPQDLLRDLDQLDDDELLETLTLTDRLATELSQAAQRLRNVMYQRMVVREATLAETPRFTVKLVPQREYQYDLTKLLTLKSHLTGEQFERTFKTTVTPNKTELNKLVKLGGQIKVIIESAVTEIPRAAKMEITPKGDEA